jgi:hypothetical protein
MVTGAFSPSGARSAGHDAIAEASEAHEANMARFSERLRLGCEITSRDVRRPHLDEGRR